MESLCNYASDDDDSTSPKREITSKFTRTNGMEADANYEQVTMDMSEQESNQSSTKSPRLKDRTSPSSTASSPSISQSPQSRSPRTRRTRKYESHSDIKTSSSDEEKTKSHKRHRKNKSRDHHSKKRSRRSRSRSSGKKRSRKSNHSRSKKRSRRSHSRSKRNGSSKRSSSYSKHESKNHKKSSSRSNSKEKFTTSHNYFIEKKANNKRQILDKLGIELKVPLIGSVTLPPATQVTPQQLLQKSMEAQVEKVKVQTGIELPSYYNPVAVNPNKYAEQIQKRKLLWGNKQNDVVRKIEVTKPTITTANKTATIWQSTKFGDQDGKVTAKFKRLMGIKDNNTGVDNPNAQQGQSKDIIKKQEEMFNSMESQYEVARMATHTHRGLGLGFGTFQQR